MALLNEYVNQHITRLSDYIKVVTGNTTNQIGEFEKLAVERFIKLQSEFIYKESELIRILKFCSLLNLPLDNQIQQVQLLGWQLFTIANLYCLYKNETTRLHDIAYVEIAKKNGKSTLCAILSLYDCIADYELNSQVLFVACSKDQAHIALTITKLIIENSPLLQSSFTINKNKIINKEKGILNQIEVKASDAKLVQGNGVSLSIVDEYAFSPDSELQNKIKSGQIARTNPLQIIITTAAANPLTSPAYSLRQTAGNILKGLIQNTTFFALIFSLDQKEEIERPECWRKPNPSINHTIKLESLEREYETAKLIPDKLQTFITDNLNWWTDNINEVWIEDDKIVTCLKDDLQIPSGSKIYIGMDLSSNTDLSAIALLYYDKAKDTFISKVIHIMPNNQRKYIKKGSINLENWMNDNYIIKCQTPVLDDDLIFELIEKINSEYQIKSIGYDKWNASIIANRLNQKLNIDLNAVAQNVSSLSFPLRILENYVLNGKFFSNRNPVTRWQFSNVKLYKDINNNRKLDKRKGESIDGIVALNIAMHQYLADNYNDMGHLLEKFNF